MVRSHGLRPHVPPLQGERLMVVLKHCFPVPKADSKRVLTFSNDSDYISFRHHTFNKAPGSKDVDLKEVRCRGVKETPWLDACPVFIVCVWWSGWAPV